MSSTSNANATATQPVPSARPTIIGSPHPLPPVLGYQIYFRPDIGYYYGPPIPHPPASAYRNPHSLPQIAPTAPKGPAVPHPSVPSSAPRVPLGDATNAPKRTAANAAMSDSSAAKRPCPTPATSAPSPTVFGVGPSTVPPPPPTADKPKSVTPSVRESAAKDVWACTVPLDAQEKRIPHPPGTSNLTNPGTPKVQCIFCGYVGTPILSRLFLTLLVSRQAFLNRPGGGTTSTIRRHLKNRKDGHFDKYRAIAKSLGVKVDGDPSNPVSDDTETLFTHDGFMERLLRWMVVDDQVCSPTPSTLKFVLTESI